MHSSKLCQEVYEIGLQDMGALKETRRKSRAERDEGNNLEDRLDL